mgnify:CR=1 FL=1
MMYASIGISVFKLKSIQKYFPFHMKFFSLNATHSGYCNRMGFQWVVGKKMLSCNC